MRLVIFVIILLVQSFLSTQIHSQHLQKMPDKDPVMIIDKLMPCKNKQYKWSSDNVKFTIRNNDKNCKKIKVTFNNKPVLQHYCLVGEKSFNLKLTKNTNIILLTTDRDNTSDSTFVTVMLAGERLPYAINVLCRKNIYDTIFIRH